MASCFRSDAQRRSLRRMSATGCPSTCSLSRRPATCLRWLHSLRCRNSMPTCVAACSSSSGRGAAVRRAITTPACAASSVVSWRRSRFASTRLCSEMSHSMRRTACCTSAPSCCYASCSASTCISSTGRIGRVSSRLRPRQSARPTLPSRSRGFPHAASTLVPSRHTSSSSGR